jgi:hypothetical protein
VLEVAHAGGDEHDAVLVAALDGVRVPHAAAGVRDRRDARLARLLDRVAPAGGWWQRGVEWARGRGAGQRVGKRLQERVERRAGVAASGGRGGGAPAPRGAHLKGKNASLARTEPLTSAAAFSSAISVDLTLRGGSRREGARCGGVRG